MSAVPWATAVAPVIGGFVAASNTVPGTENHGHYWGTVAISAGAGAIGFTVLDRWLNGPAVDIGHRQVDMSKWSPVRMTIAMFLLYCVIGAAIWGLARYGLKIHS